MDTNNNGVKYLIRKTDFCDDEFLHDFLYVKNKVWNTNQGLVSLKKQYLSNPYGASIMVIAYIGSNPVACDALWRNDIGDIFAYQSADTCVLPECRGRGVFKEMVRLKVQEVEKNALIYGFPNSNSFPGFIKMGWKLISEYRPAFFCNINQYREEHPQKLDITYANYWFVKKEGYGVIMRGGAYLLVAKRSKLPIYTIVAEVDEDTSKLFASINPLCLLLYKSKKPRWFNKSRIPTRIITCKDTFDVPVWKLDVI